MPQHIHVSPLGFPSDLQDSTKQTNNNKTQISMAPLIILCKGSMESVIIADI